VTKRGLAVSNCVNGLRILPAAAVSVLLLLAAGCGESPQTSASAGRGKAGGKENSRQYPEELFANAVDNLNRLEEFDLSDVQQQIAKVVESMGRTGELPAGLRSDPLRATWPEPETLRQVVDRLNKWAQSQEPPANWKPDPLLAALPVALTGSATMRNLDNMDFSYYDGFTLQEAVWLRDLSNQVRGKRIEELQRARNLFDWTVRNIQLMPDSADRLPQFPWEVLLLGRGTALERAWVFILLCRQQRMDAALLSIPVEGSAPGWWVAVLVEKDLYLFDPALGLPVPAPQGVRLDGAGQLDVQPATLKQVMADPAILGRLESDADRPYWARRANWKQITVLVEASPLYLSKRTKLLESRLSGQQSMLLSTDASAQAERLKAAAGAVDARLWRLPFETLRRRANAGLDEVRRQLVAILPFFIDREAPLFKGRALQLKGKLTGKLAGEPGAVKYLQDARPPTSDLQAAPISKEEKIFFGLAKVHASYWLGLIAFEQAQYDSAIDYFTKRTLDTLPNGPWTPGAHYNLARTYEAKGQRAQAVAEYRAGVFSPLECGNMIRARWLEEPTPDKVNKASKESKVQQGKK
jgi:tetratricopeptide (TPR) repeat protein